MLPHPAQRTCIQAAARHLRPGGTLFIEAFRLDPQRFDAHGQRTEHRHAETGTHTVRSRHDPAGRALHITHILREDDGTGRAYDVTLYYASLAQLDAIGPSSRAGTACPLARLDRDAAAPGSTDPVSLYRRPWPAARSGQEARNLSARSRGTGLGPCTRPR